MTEQRSGLQKMPQALAFILCACAAQAWAQVPNMAQNPPVWIGFDDAYGVKTNTSAMVTELGIKAAMEEINNSGGVLNGRPLKLASTDNKGVAARGKDNFVQLAATKDLVAVLSGKYSPISVEMLPEAHRLKVPLISVWGSADAITDHDYQPSYSFRLSLKDDWGVEAMMKRLSTKYKVRQACAILPNTAWGRSAEKVIQEKAARTNTQFSVLRWYNWGDASFTEHYKACLDARTQGLLFVGNEKEGAILVKEIAAQNPSTRLIASRVGSEIIASLRQANDLANSTDVWTGLTDSAARASYLLPILGKANQNKNYQFELLDYLGRFVVQSGNTTGLLLGALPNIQQTIEDNQVHLGLATIEQTYFMAISVPVSAYFSDSIMGMVLLYLDLDKMMASLNFPSDLKVHYSLTPFVETAADVSKHSETFKFEWNDGGKDQAIHIQLQQSYLSAFLFVMAGLAVSLTSGALLLLGLRRWTQLFSERTTSRLEGLVQMADDTVQGRGDASRIDVTGDEIAQVANALKSMLQKQRLAMQEQAVFTRVFETAAEAILITNKHGLVVDMNAALTDMTGYSKAELVNHPAGRLYISEEKGIDLPIIAEAVRKNGFWRGETYFLNKQQKPLPVLLSVSTLLDSQGLSQGHVSVFSDIRAIREAENKLKQLLHEDQLTGLPNYRGFLEYIQQKKDGSRFAILFIDLDNFKNINDTFGHDQGDEVIRQMAQYLKATLPSGNFLCRRSGDEFIAVLETYDPITDFQNNLELIFKPAFFTVNHMGSVQVTATFSAGAALFPHHSQNINELLVYADTALLSAKESGRNQIQWLDAQMMAASSRKTQVDSKLAVAIREGRIHPHYQAEVDLVTGKIIGFEALARWHDEELGMVSPAEFIPLAEQSGAIDPLTQHLFAQVVKDSLTIRAQFPGATIAMNSSPQLLAGKRLLTILSQLSKELENGLQGFVLEVTETDFSLSPEELNSQLLAIMSLGVRIAIDDFGKSYSSLSRLASMPIQKLKIDMSFTAGMEREENTKIIAGILALARSLRLEVTAEGVENRFQHDGLIELGCQQAQGYLYSKPMQLQDLIQLPTHLLP